MKASRPVVVRPWSPEECAVVLDRFLVEVQFQMGPVSDEQLPGLWDNLRLRGPRRICTIDLASSPYGMGQDRKCIKIG